MAVVETWEYHSLASFDDPDDYRPDSELAIVLDPSRGDGKVAREVTVFYERIAPGDEIPLHKHTIAEVFFLDEGRVDARLGENRETIGPGAVVFVPAGQEHGFRNVGEGVARIHAVFPSEEITIEYLERNPAPGTEGDDPAPPVAIDVRELLEGDPEKAVRELR